MELRSAEKDKNAPDLFRDYISFSLLYIRSFE